jgi:hypothetical protein
VLRPVYDIAISVTGAFTPPSPWFHEIGHLSAVFSLFVLAISIAGGVHFDLVKRVLRDITRVRPCSWQWLCSLGWILLQVGQNPSEVINQITDTVFPMYKAFIEPDLTFATIKIQNTFNPFQVRQRPFAHFLHSFHSYIVSAYLLIFGFLFSNFAQGFKDPLYILKSNVKFARLLSSLSHLTVCRWYPPSKK